MDDKKRRTLISGITVIAVFILAAVLFILAAPNQKQDRDAGVSSGQAEEESQDMEGTKDDQVDADTDMVEGSVEEIEDSEEKVSADEQQSEETEPESSNSEPDNNGTSSKPGNNTQNAGESSNQTDTMQPVLEHIILPYNIPDSPLVLEQINPYDGVFLEDGSDRNVENITAIVVKNTSDRCAEYIDIKIQQGDRQLQFIGSALESGGTMVIFEANASGYQEGDYTECSAVIAWMKEMEMSEEVLKVEESADGGLTVTNIGSADIAELRIFYKNYMQDADVYVGGITYTSKVENLSAGDSMTIYPSHYLKGSSKVLMVKTY